MTLVAAKCTQCGGNINVDDSKEAGVCEFCNTAFITEKVINNYTTHIHNDFTGATVNISENNFDKLMKQGRTFLKFEDYLSASNIFSIVIKEYPHKYIGYYLLIISLTKDFTYINTNVKDRILDLKPKIEKIIKENEKDEYFNLCKRIERYCNKIVMRDQLSDIREKKRLKQIQIDINNKQTSTNRKSVIVSLLILAFLLVMYFLSSSLLGYPIILFIGLMVLIIVILPVQGILILNCKHKNNIFQKEYEKISNTVQGMEEKMEQYII